jgi:diphthamide synthase subunit DPH2
MDIFVLIASPEESILPAKGFFKPVLHPWEFMMACSDEDWTGAYSANWTDLLEAELKASVKGKCFHCKHLYLYL